jgi:hypothetical protein
MHRRLLYAVAAVVAALGMFTAAASASGPLAPGQHPAVHAAVDAGKFVITWKCDDPIGTVLVTEEHAFFQAVGLGQIVGERLHGIPVAFTGTYTDVRMGEVIGFDSGVTGNGHAHPGKPTTHCYATDVLPGVSARDFFGDPLPPDLVGLGVRPDDVIIVDLTVEVIVGP